jgi:hypothetical protein
MPAETAGDEGVTPGGLSLAEEVYLVLHYGPLDGALLRNGKVNGSEAQALSAAKLVDLVDDGALDLERPRRSTSHALVPAGVVPVNPVLVEALGVVGSQRKQRSLTWGLVNLGATAPIVERLVALGLVVPERRPEAPLTPAGLEVLAASRSALDTAVLDPAARHTERAELVAAVIHAAKVWRNVYVTKERAEREAIEQGLARRTRDVLRDGDHSRVIGQLAADSVAA